MSENLCPLPDEDGKPCGGILEDRYFDGHLMWCDSCDELGSFELWQALRAATERAENAEREHEITRGALHLEGKTVNNLGDLLRAAEARVRELENGLKEFVLATNIDVEHEEYDYRVVSAANGLAKAILGGDFPLRDSLAELNQELQGAEGLVIKLGGLLSRTAVALKGPEPELTRWSTHDLPECAATMMARAAEMEAELERLRPVVEAEGGEK